MPWMRYIPSRFAAWKRAAEDSRKKDGDVFCGLYEHVQENIVIHHAINNVHTSD